MTISITDIQWRQSQRNDDTVEGGGPMSAQEIVDGELNNAFSNKSPLDSVTGRLQPRKTFPGLFSNDLETYFGAGVILSNPPLDGKVEVVMTAGEWFDRLPDIRERIESYQIPGANTPWRLFGDQVQGQGVITLYGFPEYQSFDLGQTLFLENEDTGDNEAIRVSEVVSRQTLPFEDGAGIFFRDVLEIELSRPLLNTWEGNQVERVNTDDIETVVRKGQVSAGATYKGVKVITENITAGDLSVQITSPLAQLVPSNTAETALADQPVSLTAASFGAAGAADAISVSTGSVAMTAGTPKSFYVGSTMMPGSVAISGTVTGTDNGDGTIEVDGSATTIVANYREGSITVTRSSGGSISLTITATPGAAVATSNLTSRKAITVQTVGLNHVFSIRPLAAPGTITVSYRALERWYTLTEAGAGVLAGDGPAEGGGTYNFGTGSLTVTLAELPDIGSDIIVQWGTAVSIDNRSGDIDTDTPEIRGQLSISDPIKPGTLEFAYLHDAAEVVIEDDGEGDLQVQGTTTAIGRVVYATGEYAFRPTDWPDSGSALEASFETSIEEQEQFQPTPTGATDEVTFTLATAPRPGSLRFSWPVSVEVNDKVITLVVVAVDDGNGGLEYTGERVAQGPIAGSSVNYGTGEVSFAARAAYGYRAPVYIPGPDVDGQNNPVVEDFAAVSDEYRFLTGSTVTVQYQDNTALSTADTQTIEIPPIVIDTTPLITDTVPPGCVRFTFNGRTYVDRAGDLVYGVNPLNNAGTLGGSFDYSTGRATLTDYSSSGSFLATMIGLATVSGATPTSRLFFRTASAPIKQASLTVQALSYEDGSLLTATADINGDLTAALVTGTVDVDTGIAQVRFGEMVTAAGNEGEWWYDADQVEGGQIFKPTLIVPGSATYSAVAFKFIPSDPEVTGIDAIRLPQTGRVPIYRVGDVGVIHQTKTVEDASPTAGAAVDMGLPSIQWARVRDANGEDVLSEKYIVLPATGEIQWANPLDLSAYTGPFEVTAMAYFQALITEVTIGGQIGLNFEAPWGFDASSDDLYLSSKLILIPDGGTQDWRAFYINLHDLVSWGPIDGFEDNPGGGGAAAQYDDNNYPIALTNQGTITEKWVLLFTGANTVNVIGENVGQILTGASIASTIAPINPATGVPYFSIDPDGWGGGWNAGNALRLDTVGANVPVWFIRAVQPGSPDPEVQTDRVIAHLQGAVTP